MAKLDTYEAHPIDSLKARGPKVVSELLAIVQERAEADDETFADACSKLPPAWQATMLLAHVVRRLEEGTLIPEVLQDFAEVDDRTIVISALKEIGEKPLASTFQSAEEVLDEDPSSWMGFNPPDKTELVRLRKKLFILVGSMDEAFPSAP